MIIFLTDFCFFDLTDFFRFVMIFIRKFYTEKQKTPRYAGSFSFASLRSLWIFTMLIPLVTTVKMLNQTET